jgi:hypothetical protein
MEYIPRNIDGLRKIIADLPGDMTVEPAPDTGIMAETVDALKQLTVLPVFEIRVTTPRTIYPESTVKIDKAV